MPSATGQNWEKYKKEFADDEEPEKKITPLTDEYVVDSRASMPGEMNAYLGYQGYTSIEDLRSCTLCCRSETIREADQGEANQCQREDRSVSC